MSPQFVSSFNGDALTVEFELVCLRVSEGVRRQIELPNQFELCQLILDAVDPDPTGIRSRRIDDGPVGGVVAGRFRKVRVEGGARRRSVADRMIRFFNL